MLRGLLRLAWLEIKIFAREPLGLFGSVGVPVLVFMVLGRLARPLSSEADPDLPPVLSADLPVFGVLLIALSGVLSLAAIVSRSTTVPIPVLCSPTTSAAMPDEPVSSSAPPITTSCPSPSRPTTARC